MQRGERNVALPDPRAPRRRRAPVRRTWFRHAPRDGPPLRAAVRALAPRRCAHVLQRRLVGLAGPSTSGTGAARPWINLASPPMPSTLPAHSGLRGNGCVSRLEERELDARRAAVQDQDGRVHDALLGWRPGQRLDSPATAAARTTSATAHDAMRASRGSARLVSTIGTRAPSTMPALDRAAEVLRAAWRACCRSRGREPPGCRRSPRRRTRCP